MYFLEVIDANSGLYVHSKEIEEQLNWIIRDSLSNNGKKQPGMGVLTT
jgi:hypothetical protein